MIDAIRERWRDLLANLWFVPLIIVAGFALTAIVLVRVDELVWSSERLVGFGGDAEAARDILSTTAGSLITIAGVTFSVTIVVLQLASSQYSPRVLRTFLSDRITQATVGTFVGLFIYLLLALRSVRSTGDDGRGEFVPALSVTIGLVLAVLALALLLLFINNVASMTQAETIAARISRSLEGPIEAIEAEGPIATGPPPFGEPVCPDRSGYVQSVAPDEIARDLKSGRWTITALVAPGGFVTTDRPLATVRREDSDGGPQDTSPDAAVREAFRIADQRDVVQDPEFGLRQLGDIALKALSPSIHDPTTALLAVGYMRGALVDLAGRRLGDRVEEVGDGRIRFRHAGRTIADYAAPLLEVGGHATAHPRVGTAVLDALLATLARAEETGSPSAALARRAVDLAEILVADARRPDERDALRRRVDDLRAAVA